jgi:hypothetical protein
VRAFLIARAGEQHLGDADPRVARDQRSMKRIWLLIAITMLVLGINKQLDLQTLVIQKVRRQAYIHGWYADRRRYQMDFITAISVVGLIVTIGLSVWLRRVLRRLALAIAGVGMLVLFVVIRATSFHYVDRALSLGERVHLNWIIELCGIGLVALAAVQWQLVERRRIESSLPTASPVDDTHLHSTSAV